MLISRRAALLSSLSAGLGAGISAAGHAATGARVDLVVSADGTARIGETVYRCALGRSGIKREKREGDGATPQGVWPLREVIYRADRLSRPKTALPVRAMRRHDGWCDAPGDARYNRHVTLPYPASAEVLWRVDHLYDLVVVVGYNDAPVVSGAGSAIFLHVARPRYSPTVGCVAFAPADSRAILSRLDARSVVDIRG